MDNVFSMRMISTMGRLCERHRMMIKTLKETGRTAATAMTTVHGFLFLFFVLLFVAAFHAWTDHLDTAQIRKGAVKPATIPIKTNTSKPTNTSDEISFACRPRNKAKACPIHSSLIGSSKTSTQPAPSKCPDYFRWIHEDLRPWKDTGISREMVLRAQSTANFRLLIVNGKVYIERYQRSFQSRDKFTLWGILQLLRRYPGQLPDVDLMFDCFDRPVIRANEVNGTLAAPPPLFRYCGNDETLDIVFPDWSFWGWPEINIKPWESLLEELEKGNEQMKWMEREPYAYWKGNPSVAAARQDLLKCNVSKTQDWNARLFNQDWRAEAQGGFRSSDLSSQCNYRYKIYIEGATWSVSDKYILACDSLTLMVNPQYYDFFTRGLMPLQHYWPVQDNHKCRSIKFAVEWGNAHKQKVHNIGKEASSFIQEELKMDYVYDYMYHLLLEYSKLMRYKPTIPSEGIEICSESMACPALGLAREFMMKSMVKTPVDSLPCSMPPPFTPSSLQSHLRRKANAIKQVEQWEDRRRE